MSNLSWDDIGARFEKLVLSIEDSKAGHTSFDVKMDGITHRIFLDTIREWRDSAYRLYHLTNHSDPKFLNTTWMIRFIAANYIWKELRLGK